ncbi:MAG TPA: hypothetical protein VK783_09365 [Bacteroidia bacterium]|jgi:hypothetical protein|nr:hypothetical protein [Bacteroidia bacterium]
MKYKPTPLNIISALIILRVIWIIVGAIEVHEDHNTWALLIPLIFLILIIPFVLLGADYAIQSQLKGKKYIHVLATELIIVALGLIVLWCCGIRSLADLKYYL